MPIPSSTIADVVRSFDEAIVYHGDFDRAMTFAAPDITVREAPGLPYRNAYVGKQGLQDLMVDVGGWFEFDGPLALEFHAVDDTRVVARISGRARVLPTGQEIDFLVTEWATVIDGRVVDIEVFYFDQAPLLAAASAAHPPNQPTQERGR